MKQKGELALLSAAFLYGFFGVFSKIINFHLPIFYQSWVRNIFAVMVLGIALLIYKKWKPVAWKDHIWFFLRSVCGFISFIGIYIAFTGLDIGTTYFLSFAASVVAGYMLGIIVFKEKLTGNGILSFVLALIGLIFVYRVNINPQTLPFVCLAVISGLAAPGWSAFSKKISSIYSNLELNVIDSLYAALFPFVISLFVREPWVPIEFNAVWISTFFFGLMFIINGLLIVYGYSKVSVQTGSIIMLFEIVAGIALGYLFFHESLSPVGLIGGSFIVGAIVIRSLHKESI